MRELWPGSPCTYAPWLASDHRLVDSCQTALNKQHLTWTQIEDLAIRLADRLPTNYEVMLVITRGGMVPACIISSELSALVLLASLGEAAARSS